MTLNEDLKRYGINIPSIIYPQQIGGLAATGVPEIPQEAMSEVTPKVYKKQKWFRSYNVMIQWKSHDGVSDAVMVRMKRPYRGYLFQLHYNSASVTNKSRGIAR